MSDQRTKVFSIAVNLTIVAGLMLTSCGTYEPTILAPWEGASKEELVAKWGYPQSANDIVKVEPNVVVYTCRSSSSYGGNSWSCAVSFTLTDDVVTAFKYVGPDCIRHKRYE